MEIKKGNGKTQFGAGVDINLTGEEIATAVFSWLVGHGVNIDGPRTIRVNGELINNGNIYVDPSGGVFVNPPGVVAHNGERFS